MIVKGRVLTCIVKLCKFHQIFFKKTILISLLGQQNAASGNDKKIGKLCKALEVFFIEIILFLSRKICSNSCG